MTTSNFEEIPQTCGLLSTTECSKETQAEENPDSENEAFPAEIPPFGCMPSPKKRHLGNVVLICLVLFVLITTTIRSLPKSQSSMAPTSSTNCQNPSIRREWRTLSTAEKLAYIDAVVCLTKSSSIVGRNQTVFDDFPWIHNTEGKSCEYTNECSKVTQWEPFKHKHWLNLIFGLAHDSALFLPWHRYFLHVYEKQLRNVCRYSGSLVFVSTFPSLFPISHHPLVLFCGIPYSHYVQTEY